MKQLLYLINPLVTVVERTRMSDLKQFFLPFRLMIFAKTVFGDATSICYMNFVIVVFIIPCFITSDI